MHLVLSADDCADYLKSELRRAWPATDPVQLGSRLFGFAAHLDAASPRLVFGRQLIPTAIEATAASISQWADRLREVVSQAEWSEDQPWFLHVEPCYGAASDSAGRNRCGLIQEAFRERLRKQHRRRLRCWRAEPEPFRREHSLVQLLLTEPEKGFISVAPAPLPHQLRAMISPFPMGEIPLAVDKAAPSRAFAKLVEAEMRLGRSVAPGETCVDLGAAPGSWSYVALQRGARVIAVDRAPLREDLMRHPGLTFCRGDAFKFEPSAAVDWLICDVIAAPERSIELVMEWVARRRTRYFVVTIKFKGDGDYAELDRLKQALPPLCDEFHLLRLCANKNEACAFGAVAGT